MLPAQEGIRTTSLARMCVSWLSAPCLWVGWMSVGLGSVGILDSRILLVRTERPVPGSESIRQSSCVSWDGVHQT